MNKQCVQITTGNGDLLQPLCDFNCSDKYGAGQYKNKNKVPNSPTHSNFIPRHNVYSLYMKH